MTSPNWKVIRTEYETLHTGIKELAASHHTSEALITAAVTDGKWERLSSEALDTEGLSERLAALDLRHQTELVPRFISLQSKMLTKCDSLLDMVTSIEDADKLKTVSEVIEKHRPNIMGTKKDAGADNAITVRILSKVGNGDDVAVNAVEITKSAGETNGLGAVNRLN